MGRILLNMAVYELFDADATLLSPACTPALHSNVSCKVYRAYYVLASIYKIVNFIDTLYSAGSMLINWEATSPPDQITFQFWIIGYYIML